MFNSINSVNIKEGEYCYALISAAKDDILCTVINAKTEKTLLNVPFSNGDTFIKKIYFNNAIYKAVIVITCQFKSPQLCAALKEKLNKLKIPNYFTSNINFIFSSLLIAANVNIKFDETVLMVVVTYYEICISEVKYTPNGYEKIWTDVVDPNEDNYAQKLREKIQQSTNAKKILAIQYDPSPAIKSILKSKKLVVFSHNLHEYQDKFIIETCKWLLDKSYTKYYVLPIYNKGTFAIASYSQAERREKDLKGKPIIGGQQGVGLPYSRSEIFERTFHTCWLYFVSGENNNTVICQKIHYSRNCHRLKLNLSIDDESFETYNIEKIFLEEVESLPQKLNAVMETKIPVIGFFDNSSVVCINKNGNYQFSDSCNGPIGLNNFISFDEKKPKYGEDAVNVLWKKSTYVVYDLLKVMSMEKDNIQIDETWDFKITRDSENSVLIEYDDFNNPGKRTAASPAFLMALLIKKQYFKAIKAESGGESPKEIGIWIYDQFDEDEMKRVKDGLEEACKLLKVKCCFVNC